MYAWVGGLSMEACDGVMVGGLFAVCGQTLTGIRDAGSAGVRVTAPAKTAADRVQFRSSARLDTVMAALRGYVRERPGIMDEIRL